MDENRVWRQDREAMLSGVCTGLAEDLDLPLPLIRVVTAIFFILPTGLAYLALSMLLRRRPQRRATRLAGTSYQTGTSYRVGNGAQRPSYRTGQSHPPDGKPPTQNFALLVHRFEALEPRLKRIEAFVTSKNFELERGFRKMGE